MDKKLSEISIRNITTAQEINLKSKNFIFRTDIRLQAGPNQIEVFSTKKKAKFRKEIRVFFNTETNPDAYTTAYGPAPVQETCELHIAGTYNLRPQLGSSDIIIFRNSNLNFPVQFLVNCCEGKSVTANVENQHQQLADAQYLGDNVFRFQAKLTEYENVFTVRAKCKGKLVTEQKIIVRVNTEYDSRLDTAIIFAVSRHNRRARRLGWVDLKYSEEDAKALKWTLENKFGFHAKIVMDPTWEQIHASMNGLRHKEWGKMDQLFIFFSGHGHRAEGVGYLIPSNAEESVKTYYRLEDLRAQVDEIACNNIALGIDACFASSFLERGGKDIVNRRGTADVHNLLSTDAPFRYFIGSSPSNKEVPEKGIFVKDSKHAKGKYKYQRKKFKISEFMKSFLEAIEDGEKELNGGPVPIWYVGRRIEELYRPKKLINGQQVYARATRFGSQHDKGFHFIPYKPLTQ